MHPAIPAARTLFNLVPCNRKLEVAMAQTLDRTFKDVAAFAKNAGPQALRIDYLTDQRRLSLYTTAFIARKTDGTYLLIETKGRVDKDVPLKAQAAVGWCKAASASGVRWEYLYVPERVFLEFSGELIADLESVCATHLADLITERAEPQLTLGLGESAEEAASLGGFVSPEDEAVLPEKIRKHIGQAVAVFRFLERKSDASFADAFTSLRGPIDDMAKALLRDYLAPAVPDTEPALTQFFTGDLSSAKDEERKSIEWNGSNLRKLLVDGSGVMPIGVLRWTLNYAKSPRPNFGCIFNAIRVQIGPVASKEFATQIESVNKFRNNYVAHQDHELTDVEKARQGLREWVAALSEMVRRRKSER